MEIKIKIDYDEKSKFTVVTIDSIKKDNKLKVSELPWVKCYRNSKDLIQVAYGIFRVYPCQEVIYKLEVSDKANEILADSSYFFCLEDIIYFQNSVFSSALSEKVK